MVTIRRRQEEVLVGVTKAQAVFYNHKTGGTVFERRKVGGKRSQPRSRVGLNGHPSSSRPAQNQPAEGSTSIGVIDSVGFLNFWSSEVCVRAD